MSGFIFLVSIFGIALVSGLINVAILAYRDRKNENKRKSLIEKELKNENLLNIGSNLELKTLNHLLVGDIIYYIDDLPFKKEIGVISKNNAPKINTNDYIKQKLKYGIISEISLYNKRIKLKFTTYENVEAEFSVSRDDTRVIDFNFEPVNWIHSLMMSPNFSSIYEQLSLIETNMQKDIAKYLGEYA